MLLAVRLRTARSNATSNMTSTQFMHVYDMHALRRHVYSTAAQLLSSRAAYSAVLWRMSHSSSTVQLLLASSQAVAG